MNITTETLLQLVILPILGWGIKLLSDIREHLRVLNGRVTKIETWSEGHETLDIERAIALKEKIQECATARLAARLGDNKGVL